MFSTELAAITFAACNSARVLAYFPQIVRIARDRNGSPGVSCLTWVGFAAANFSTVAYALVVGSDRVMAVVFGVNAVFCLAIVTLTVCKRFRSGASDSGRPRRCVRESKQRERNVDLPNLRLVTNAADALADDCVVIPFGQWAITPR